MRKKLLGLLLVGVLAMALMAMGAHAAKYTIAFCIPSFDVSDLYERMYVMTDQRLKELGVDYELILQAMPTPTEYEMQLRQVEAMIEREVDFLILGSGDPKIAAKPLRLIREAGIPAIMITFLDLHEDERDRPVRYVGFDQVDGAEMSASSILYHLSLKYRQVKGKVVLIYGSPGWLTDTRGFTVKNILEQFPKIEIVDEHYAYVDRVKAYEYTLDLVRTHPDIDVIYAITSSMGLGAAAAVAELGYSDQIAVYGVGGTGEEYEEIAKGRMYGSMGRIIDEKGIAIADTIYAVLVKGEEVPLVWAGPWYMLDRVSYELGVAEELIEEAVGRSRAIMGR